MDSIFGLKGCSFLNFYSASSYNYFLALPSWFWWLSLNYWTEVQVFDLYLFSKLNIFSLYFSSYSFFFIIKFFFSTNYLTPGTKSTAFSLSLSCSLLRFFILGWKVHSINYLYYLSILILLTISSFLFLFISSGILLFTI